MRLRTCEDVAGRWAEWGLRYAREREEIGMRRTFFVIFDGGGRSPCQWGRTGVASGDARRHPHDRRARQGHRAGRLQHRVGGRFSRSRVVTAGSWAT